MVVVQVVILFGYETWVLTPRLDKTLVGLHHQATWWMSGMGPKRQPYSMWVYPPIGAVLVIVRMEEIGVYITRCQNTAAKYITTSPIIEFCFVVEQKLVMRLSRQWWKQPALYIMGIRAGQVSVEGREETGGRIGVRGRSRVGEGRMTEIE